MNKKIKKLRDQSQNAIPRISAERALLVTEFYKSDLAHQVSVPVRRALAFEYILENKKICINDGELIVGERGPVPKAVPTYPEITLHSLEDLKTLDTRPKVWFRVDKETMNVYRDVIIPFWKGKSNRDLIFKNLDKEWHDAYVAGVFTEFQEQRAPGHTVLGKKMFRKGFLDLKKEIAQAIENLDFFNDPEAFAKREELKAMDIAAGAVICFAERHADTLEKLSEEEKDEDRKIELMQMAAICRKGPSAVIKSAAKIDHLRTGGTLLNQKFTPSLLEDEKGLDSLVQLIRSYFRMDGHHIQFNVVTADTLRKARKHPEDYKDLIVRVAGYSDYFNDLGEELQDEIIRRTENEEF